MNEIVKGLVGFEVIADDFLVSRFGDNYDEALANYNVNLQSFLRACECGLKLNLDKVKLRCSSITFIGYVLTDKGLTPDPEKIKAIVNMPTPTSVISLQEFL